MNKCKKCESLFEKAVYNELDEHEKEFFHEHLTSCKNCQGNFEELNSTLKLVKLNNEREPDETFMENFWDTLEPNLRKKNTSNRPLHLRIPDWLSFNFKWKYQIAGGLALLILGFFLGKYLTGGNESTNTNIQPDKIKTEFSENAVNAEASKYLERSKVILLGITNFDPSKEDDEVVSLQYMKKISKQLAAQGVVLKDDLRDPSQQELKRLVANLELIMLQIANLETKHDINGIELIKDLVNSKGIFLKINIQQLMENSRIQNEQKNSGNKTDKENKRI